MCENKYINIQSGEELDLNKVKGLKANAMLKVNPHLWIEWDFEKNDELGFDVYKVTKGSKKKMNWICEKCKSNHSSMPVNKVRSKMCIYCRGLRVNHTNSLASLNPEIASQWHPTKNGDLTPHDVTKGYDKKSMVEMYDTKQS